MRIGPDIRYDVIASMLPPLSRHCNDRWLTSKRFDAAGATARSHGARAVILQLINNNNIKNLGSNRNYNTELFLLITGTV